MSPQARSTAIARNLTNGTDRKVVYCIYVLSTLHYRELGEMYAEVEINIQE